MCVKWEVRNKGLDDTMHVKSEAGSAVISNTLCQISLLLTKTKTTRQKYLAALLIEKEKCVGADSPCKFGTLWITG